MNILMKRSTGQGLGGTWVQQLLLPVELGCAKSWYVHAFTNPEAPIHNFLKSPMGTEVCFLKLVKDPDSRANTILNVENFSFEISKRLNIASIQPFIAIPSQCRKAKKRNKMSKQKEATVVCKWYIQKSK